MIAFFKLIRWPNLLIIAFTQYMVRWFLLIPVMDLKRFDLDYSLLNVQMTEVDFFLLVLSTVMIAAAGYIINDYFDVRIDGVNRPETNVVGKVIKRRVAMGAHMAINIIGAGLGIYLSWKYNFFRVGAFLFITSPALLWFYSTKLKRQFLIGNFVIALLSGIVPMMVVLFEIPNIYKAFPSLAGTYLNLTDVLHITQILALFAFIITLIREIIKDVEDYEGDMEYGCRTMPIVIGISKTKWILAALCIFVVSMIGWVQKDQISPKTTITLPIMENTSGILVTLVDTTNGDSYKTETNASGEAVLYVPGNSTYRIEVNNLKPTIVDSAKTVANWSSVIYFILLLQLPLLYLVYRVLAAKGKSDWHFASIMIKLIMVAGICYLFLYSHQLHQLIASDVS